MTADSTPGGLETPQPPRQPPRSEAVSLPIGCFEGLEVPPRASGDSSVDCEGSAGAPLRDATPPARVCPGCGVTFTPENDQRLYCGPACKVRSKRRRERERRPSPAPQRVSACRDCGARLVQAPTGLPVQRCAPCRSLRLQERARARRREEHEARVSISDQSPPWWRRLLARWSR